MEVPSSLRWAGIGWEGLHLWLCSPLVPLLLFFYSAVSTRPLEVLWVPGSWWSRKELGSLTPGPPFPRGQDAFVNLVVWKEALSCPHCKAGLGCCPWETTLISSAPPFPCLLSPWRALGFSLGPDPNGRGSIVAARAEPSPAWVAALPWQATAGERASPKAMSPRQWLHSRLGWSVMTGESREYVCSGRVGMLGKFDVNSN